MFHIYIYIFLYYFWGLALPFHGHKKSTTFRLWKNWCACLILFSHFTIVSTCAYFLGAWLWWFGLDFGLVFSFVQNYINRLLVLLNHGTSVDWVLG